MQIATRTDYSHISANTVGTGFRGPKCGILEASMTDTLLHRHMCGVLEASLVHAHTNMLQPAAMQLGTRAEYSHISAKTVGTLFREPKSVAFSKPACPKLCFNDTCVAFLKPA